jgi:hypothetical protein
MMYTFRCYVNSCRHYKTTLLNPYKDVKKNKKLYNIDSSLEDASTIGGLCYLSRCDKKPNGKRNGLDKSN